MVIIISFYSARSVESNGMIISALINTKSGAKCASPGALLEVINSLKYYHTYLL